MTAGPSSPESHETIQVGVQLTHLLTVTRVVSSVNAQGRKDTRERTMNFPQRAILYLWCLTWSPREGGNLSRMQGWGLAGGLQHRHSLARGLKNQMGTRDHPVLRRPLGGQGTEQCGNPPEVEWVPIQRGARGRANQSEFLGGRGRYERSWVPQEEEGGYTRGRECLEPKHRGPTPKLGGGS